jgi:hypothetical protein
MRAKRLRHRVGSRQADAVVVVADQGNQNDAHEDNLLQPRNSASYNSLARIPKDAVERGQKPEATASLCYTITPAPRARRS